MSLDRWLATDNAVNLVFLSAAYLFLFLVLVFISLDWRKAGKKMKAWLELEPQKVGEEPQKFFLEGEVIIGRNEKADIFLTDRRVSSRHARIYQQEGYFYLQDLGSTNGTFVNGLPVKAPYRLEIGDKITIGPYVFFFEASK